LFRGWKGRNSAYCTLDWARNCQKYMDTSAWLQQLPNTIRAKTWEKNIYLCVMLRTRGENTAWQSLSCFTNCFTVPCMPGEKQGKCVCVVVQFHRAFSFRYTRVLQIHAIFKCIYIINRELKIHKLCRTHPGPKTQLRFNYQPHKFYRKRISQKDKQTRVQ
jgi:hypothetical protein